MSANNYNSSLGDNSSPVPAFSGKTRQRLIYVLLPVSILLLGALIFRQFLFGGAVLLYKDAGSDSINIFYPYLVHLSDYIRSEGFPSWSFYVGMGQSLSYFAGYLIWQPVVWLPRELIAHALIFQHLCKILVAGILFFRFLQQRALNFQASFLGSLLLSFSAYMCMGSCWYVQADEVVAFTALLFAAEQAVARGRWLYLVLAVALVGLVSAFHLYFCALLLLLYVPVRLFGLYSWRPRSVLRTSVLLAGAAILGVGLAAIVTLPNVYSLLHSPRGLGSTSSVATLSSLPIFGLQSPLFYITACLRPFANDILGAGSAFRGWRNYLEAPESYCGLLCLLLLPQIFIGATRRGRIICALFLSGIVLLIVFPWFRYLFWLFQGDYFRMFSLLSILGVITLGMTAFSRYTEGHDLHLWLLGATIVILLGILYFPISEFQALIDSALRRTATIFLLLYAVLLAIGRLLRRQSVIGWIIVIAVAFELIYFNQFTVSDRPVVTKQELKERVGYNDETVDAMHDLKTSDATFYRLTKTWPSGLSILTSLNDALMFGYYGTASYSSFNNLNYINFLLAVGAISDVEAEAEVRWSIGLLSRPLLSLFACEKYLLAKDPVPFQMDDRYEFVKRYGNVYLFRNRLFLPLGLTYRYYIVQDAFLQLSKEEKARALFHAVVVSDRNEPDKAGLSPLSIDALKQQMMETPLPDAIAARRTTALNISSFRQTRIDGSVHLDQTNILVLQTPFDQGWYAFQDGRSASVLKVDAGLLGVLLDRGEHKVTLRYRPPFLLEGATITLASVLILAVGLWRWPRVRLPV